MNTQKSLLLFFNQNKYVKWNKPYACVQIVSEWYSLVFENMASVATADVRVFSRVDGSPKKSNLLLSCTQEQCSAKIMLET